jgi:hypothetical protein
MNPRFGLCRIEAATWSNHPERIMFDIIRRLFEGLANTLGSLFGSSRQASDAGDQKAANTDQPTPSGSASPDSATQASSGAGSVAVTKKAAAKKAATKKAVTKKAAAKKTATKKAATKKTATKKVTTKKVATKKTTTKKAAAKKTVTKKVPTQ